MAQRSGFLPAVLLLTAVFAFAACGGDVADEVRDRIGDVTSTLPGEGDVPATDAPEAAPTPTEPPATEPPATEPPATEAPDPDEPAEEDGGRSNLDRVIIAVFLAVLAAALLTLFTRRGRKPEEPEGPDIGPSWAQRARSAYTNARWLHDALDSRAVVKRRSAQPSDVIRFSTDIERRHTAALNELYGLETDAPSGIAGLAVQDASRALRNLRSAFDDAAAFTGGKEPSATGEDSAAERRLLGELELARSELASALEALAGAIRDTG